MNYGIPYKGSKNFISEKLLQFLPSADTFVDLFCGGCSMTHAAIMSGRYKRFVVNDISPMGPTLFVDALSGKFRNERRWFSREDFFASDEPYVKFCWSFGNNCQDYLYSRKIELYKRACHYAIVFDEWSELASLCPEVVDAARAALDRVADTHSRRLKFGPSIVKWLKANWNADMVEANPLYKSANRRGGHDHIFLQSLQSLESLERLQSLECHSLPLLSTSSLDYRKVHIPKNSVVYCDIPYKGTSGYLFSSPFFDYDDFYEWALSRPFPVYVSEYAMPDTFHEVASFAHRSRISSTKNKSVIEKLFCTKRVVQKTKLITDDLW